MLLTYLDDLSRTVKRHRRRGWGWRYDGLDDWSTERILKQLRDIGIDTDEQRFPEQAAAAGKFKALQHDWAAQIPKKIKDDGFWAEFPGFAIPLLWERLASHAVCADLIALRLRRVVDAEDFENELPDVDGMPAGLAAGLELARFLQTFEPAHRSAAFDEVDRGGLCDYFNWLTELIQSRGHVFPDAATQIADAMADCRDGKLLQSDLALALAMAGRHEEAIARARANIERFPDNVWVRILGGDVFEELGDDDAAIRQWNEAIQMAPDHDEWMAAADRLKEAFNRIGHQAELERILSKHPDPEPEPAYDLQPEGDSSRMISSPMAAPATRLLNFDDATAPPDFSPPPRLTKAPKIGRNDPCPCGSGKKYKKCCIN
jgi:tetratricopeptide (TPR) repeat protein